MYQLAGDELSWMFKDIPRWFSEGIASVTAGQGYRYGGVQSLFDFYQEKLPGSGDGVPERCPDLVDDPRQRRHIGRSADQVVRVVSLAHVS